MNLTGVFHLVLRRVSLLLKPKSRSFFQCQLGVRVVRGRARVAFRFAVSRLCPRVLAVAFPRPLPLPPCSRVLGFGFGASGFGVWGWGFRLGVWGSGFGVPGLGFWAWGFRVGVSSRGRGRPGCAASPGALCSGGILCLQKGLNLSQRYPLKENAY